MASSRTLHTSLTSSTTADGTTKTTKTTSSAWGSTDPWSSTAFGVTGKNAMSGHWNGKTFIPHTSTSTKQDQQVQGAKDKVAQSQDTVDPNTASGVTRKKNMSQIKNNLLHPALTSHYGVTIGIPAALRPMLSGSMRNGQEQLNLSCSEAVLPGSNLAIMEINDNFTGVTERHAYRRVFDDRVNFTFYVNADNYLPIRFFEAWKSYIMNEVPEENYSSKSPNYSYRVNYPDGDKGYTATGLTITKFERDIDPSGHRPNSLTYEFIKSYPISVSSMPVSYDTSGLLKCTVSMTYLRYVVAQTGQFSFVGPEKPTSSENPNSTDPSPKPDTTGPTKDVQAFMDDSGYDRKTAETIAGGGFVETLIE